MLYVERRPEHAKRAITDRSVPACWFTIVQFVQTKPVP